MRFICRNINNQKHQKVYIDIEEQLKNKEI